MRMDIIQSLRHELQHKLTPQLLQSIKILQLSTIDLEEYLKEELEKNPTLEMVEVKEKEEEKRVEDAFEENQALDNDFSQLESMSAAYSDYIPVARGERGFSGEDKKLEALQNTAAPSISLQDHLVDQLHLLDISKDLIRIGEEIIYNLNQDGYFPYTVEEILSSMKNEMELTIEDVNQALQAVHTLEPTGVGARDLKECLLIQLGNSPSYEFERILIREHLSDIEKNRLPKIAKEMCEDMDIVKEAVSFIRKLEPRPGHLFNSETPQYVQPDVIVEETEDGYEVRILDSSIPHVRISSRYRRMLEENRNDPEVRKFVKKKLESAKWLLESLQQRKKTLTKISREIVQYQESFLREGISSIKPLTMQSIADRLEIHVSTVSRAISGKYIQTPQGILALSFFFTGGTNKEDGAVESTLSVKEKVIRMIQNEDKRHPLSDDQVAEKLKRQGFSIARRTVTKYRKQMNIPSSRQRKEY